MVRILIAHLLDVLIRIRIISVYLVYPYPDGDKLYSNLLSGSSSPQITTKLANDNYLEFSFQVSLP